MSRALVLTLIFFTLMTTQGKTIHNDNPSSPGNTPPELPEPNAPQRPNQPPRPNLLQRPSATDLEEGPFTRQIITRTRMRHYVTYGGVPPPFRFGYGPDLGFSIDPGFNVENRYEEFLVSGIFNNQNIPNFSIRLNNSDTTEFPQPVPTPSTAGRIIQYISSIPLFNRFRVGYIPSVGWYFIGGAGLILIGGATALCTFSLFRFVFTRKN